MNSFEKETLLRWFFSKTPQEQRAELMAEYPRIYNKMLGYDLLKVVRTNEADFKELEAELEKSPPD